jgi:hypothetical protein
MRRLQHPSLAHQIDLGSKVIKLVTTSCMSTAIMEEDLVTSGRLVFD